MIEVSLKNEEDLFYFIYDILYLYKWKKVKDEFKCVFRD